MNILVVDEDRATLDLVSGVLRAANIPCLQATTAESALEQFHQTHPRIIFSGMQLPDMTGLELMDRILASDPGACIVLMSSDYTTDAAMSAVRRGACDYLAKPIDSAKLTLCIHKLAVEAETREKTFQLEHELLDAYQFEGLIGRSPLMLEVFAKIRRVAPHFRTVVVTGPTGTGKELVANALHKLSPAGKAPFAVCNCSALVETLLESELFGYVKGAFTGANQDKQGIFEYANGGTVFLDEIGELPLPAQAKLLRVLQNHQVQRVGSPVPHRVEVRVVAATHRDLRKMVAQGQFREDLFYRLSVVEVSIPRLAQRREDLPMLQRHFLDKYSKLYQKQVTGITRRAQARLAAHTWPGNVRELENVISAGCIMANGPIIDLHDLPEIFRTPDQGIASDDEELMPLEQLQQRHLLRVLSRVQGNKARAAEILGVGRNTIYQMLSRIRGTASFAQHAGGGGGMAH
ncbi:MAG TPA: sigma-54 dependent transcriptional regulator [Terriglobales bacterium]|nr:sigma-54 dependent transcriptional regulator [Terriglobales bacterium]